MAEPKTKKTTASVTDFLNAIEDEGRRADAKAVAKLMKDVTGEKPALWGPSIVGFGGYMTRSGEWPIVGFAPRKTSLVLYVMSGFTGRDALMKRLGKHKTGKACLYINRLSDVDQGVLRDIVERSVTYMRGKYP